MKNKQPENYKKKWVQNENNSSFDKKASYNGFNRKKDYNQNFTVGKNNLDNQPESGEKIVEKKPRYNEKNTTTEFLLSTKGFQFLLNIGRSASFDTQNPIEEIEKLIDFYSSWTSSFPVRKNLKVSKYDFLKSVEDFCAKKENLQEIEQIFH